MKIHDIRTAIQEDALLPVFQTLYGMDDAALRYQKARYLNAVAQFSALYPDREDVRIFSAPSRTEIGGNHTDHQHGCVLAAAVSPDAIGIAAFHEDGVIRVTSEGYASFCVRLDDLSVQTDETGASALIRGIAAGFSAMGVQISGFDLYCTSDVPCGSGMSSSAAFETLIGTMIDTHYNGGKAGAVGIAKIGQFAENAYFGKNSGLMDQIVSAVGGLVCIDLLCTDHPAIERLTCDFERHGYCICITDTGGSHADLTADYAAIRSEMEHVAAQFGKAVLRQVSDVDFYREIPRLREICSDRAIVRAAHFFEENARAACETAALKDGNFTEFLRLVRKSGYSSAILLQNQYSQTAPQNQAIPLAICMSRRFLGTQGAVRVHGGGFAGTIQAFVPYSLVDGYIAEMNRIFGENACTALKIRQVGGVEITLPNRRDNETLTIS